MESVRSEGIEDRGGRVGGLHVLHTTAQERGEYVFSLLFLRPIVLLGEARRAADQLAREPFETSRKGREGAHGMVGGQD